jgi:hypothetical protein
LIANNRLVGSAGFFGPPDEEGEVEIGYSVCLVDRRRGIATAAVAALCELASARGCASIRARTTADNLGSIAVLERNTSPSPPVPFATTDVSSWSSGDRCPADRSDVGAARVAIFDTPTICSRWQHARPCES